jgi:hypothetical protein
MSKFVLTTQIQLSYPRSARRRTGPPAPSGASTRRTTFMPCLADPNRHGECDQNGGSRAGLIIMGYGRTTGACAVAAGVKIAGWAMSCSFRKTS